MNFLFLVGITNLYHAGLGETLILFLKQENIRTQKNDNTIENNTIEYIRIHNFT